MKQESHTFIHGECQRFESYRLYHHALVVQLADTSVLSTVQVMGSTPSESTKKKYCGIVQFGRTLDVNQGVGGSIPSPTARRIKNGTGARVRLIGAVLKTVGARASVGSNPTLSAKFIDIYTGYEVEQTSALKN